MRWCGHGGRVRGCCNDSTRLGQGQLGRAAEHECLCENVRDDEGDGGVAARACGFGDGAEICNRLRGRRRGRLGDRDGGFSPGGSSWAGGGPGFGDRHCRGGAS